MENWALGFFQVDLRVPTKVTGIITQGAKDFGRVQFVGSYKVAYSNDGERWITYQDEKQRKDKVRPTNLPPSQPSMSPFPAPKAHFCCQVLTGNKDCGIINARRWELRVLECWIIHHSRERGHSGEREAQVNRGKHRKVRNPQEAIMFHMFVSIEKGKSVLAPVSGSSLFPWTFFNLCLKPSLTGLSSLLSADKNPIRPRCHAGLASAFLKILFTTLQLRACPLQLHRRQCTAAAASPLISESCRLEVTAQPGDPLSLRRLQEHLLHFPAVPLKDKPYFLCLFTHHQRF